MVLKDKLSIYTLLAANQICGSVYFDWRECLAVTVLGNEDIHYV